MDKKVLALIELIRTSELPSEKLVPFVKDLILEIIK